MKVTALLPMKGHSERVPNKNLRPMCGVPLFFHVAGVLERCELVDAIVINTDSEPIADAAVRNFSKVVVHWRPDAIRGDMVSMNEIIANDLESCGGEHFVQTHSTNPLLTGETLARGIETYFQSLDRHDSVFSVTRLQTRLYWEDGRPVNHDPSELLRTQDLPPLFEENSNFYVFSKTSFAEAGNNRLGVRPKMFPMDALESLDIDEETDAVMAEVLLERRKG
jgi:CMP-N-acetylneuraminic acid synthetase